MNIPLDELTSQLSLAMKRAKSRNSGAAVHYEHFRAVYQLAVLLRQYAIKENENFHWSKFFDDSGAE